MKLPKSERRVARYWSRYIWNGEDSLETIEKVLKKADSTLDADKKFSLPTVMAELRRQLELKALAELTWPAVTDVDRLSALLQNLRARRIFAAFTYSQDHCAWAEPIAELALAGIITSPAYCVCSLCSLRDISKPVTLGLRCNLVGHDSMEELAVLTDFIEGVVQSHGFTTSRDPVAFNTIMIEGIQWRRRGQGPLELSFPADVERRKSLPAKPWGQLPPE
jgi:hypothetical protein